MRDRVSGALAWLFLGSALTGCGGGEVAGEADAGACTEPDEAVVEQIMTGARENFRPVTPDGARGAEVAEIELVEAVATRLPAEDRKLGADQVVVLQVWMAFGGQDAAEELQRVRGSVLFALDEDEQLLGPLDSFSASAFDLPVPRDPGWLAWGDRLRQSDSAATFLGCVGED